MLEAYAESRYIDAHDLLLSSSLRNTDEERNDIIFPVIFRVNPMARNDRAHLRVDLLRNLRLERQ